MPPTPPLGPPELPARMPCYLVPVYPTERERGDPMPELTPCRGCGTTDPAGTGHVYGERKCCPDCDHRPVPEPVEGELLDAVDPHGLLGEQTATPGGHRVVAYSCRCGDWEAMTNGPSSAAWALRDHDRHRREARRDG